MHMRQSNGKLDALVLADGAAEDDALARSRRRLLHEPTSVADALGGDENALSVQPIQEIAKSLTFLADQVLLRHLNVREAQLEGLVVEHDLDRRNDQSMAVRLAQVN